MDEMIDTNFYTSDFFGRNVMFETTIFHHDIRKIKRFHVIWFSY